MAKWLSVRLRTKWFWVRVQLQSFPMSFFLFAVAVGDDGLPRGIGMPVLISFINVRERIPNSAEQFFFLVQMYMRILVLSQFFFENLVCDLDCVTIQGIILKRRCFDYQITIKS